MSLTVKEACPFVPVVPVTVVMAELPPLLASVTVLPLTALLFASLRVTVMVEVESPSAICDVGLATTVDALALTLPGLTVTRSGELLIAVPLPLPPPSLEVAMNCAVPDAA